MLPGTETWSRTGTDPCVQLIKSTQGHCPKLGSGVSDPFKIWT